VETIRLSLTGTGRDGHWFRITHRGFFYAEVRTCAELGKLVDLADLKEVLLVLLLCQPGVCLRFRCV
jgi:hypothetical protein